MQPGQVLKYSAHKNLAAMAEAVGELDKATEAYLEVRISNITIYQDGNISSAILHFLD